MSIDNAEIAAHLDCLIDQIEEDNHPEDARKELLDNLETFLNAGGDPNRIAKFVGLSGRYSHFHTLVAHGAKIDIYQLAKHAKPWFGWKNLEGFISRGANIDLLISIFPADYIYDQEGIFCESEVGKDFADRLLSLGASAEKVFNLMLGWFLTFLDTQVFWDELKLLVDKGLDADIVEDWLREMIRENRGELLYRAFN